MRTIAYGAFLVLLVAASLFLLRSIEPATEAPALGPRAPSSLGAPVSSIDLDRLRDASAAELYALGVDFMHVWRPREATAIFERAVKADSTFHAAWPS
jgi:hypothetical protein